MATSPVSPSGFDEEFSKPSATEIRVGFRRTKVQIDMATSSVSSSGFDEGFSKPSATDPCASGSWSNLPVDLLHLILQRLELPQSVVVANVCTSWCSVAAAAGVPRRSTPWLISWSKKRPLGMDDWDCPIGCEFRNLVNTHRTYEVNLPSLNWVGASHGWLAGSDDLSNLLLYNPFTFATIHLPPITELEDVEAVYDSHGSIVRYICGKHCKISYGVKFVGSLFYEKVVLSGAPSQGGDYVAMIIHYGRVSFASAREGRWRLASNAIEGRDDMYADCVYHKGRFYVLTMCGILEMWDLDDPCEPRKEVFFTEGDGKYKSVYLRFLLSTPWGDLLQIRIRRRRSRQMYPAIRIWLELLEVDIENNKLVRLTSATVAAALREHAIFVGQNHSFCLPTNDFPELRPNCVYFATPYLGNDNFPYGPGHHWRGLGIYDLQNQIFEDAFPYCERRYSTCRPPSEVWIIPDL